MIAVPRHRAGDLEASCGSASGHEEAHPVPRGTWGCAVILVLKAKQQRVLRSHN